MNHKYSPVDLPQKKKWTEEERNALAQKLDDDLEQFMQEMASRKSEKQEEKKAFDFDEWCKEIDQHPAFMTEMPTDGKYKDTIEALQSMKYDKEDDEDRQMNAEHHKNEGNKHFKYKKYRWATDCYSNGIKEQCLDRKLNAVLYFNRLLNGTEVRSDAFKGAIRGAECLLELEYAKDALNWIESSKKAFAFVKETSDNPDLTEEEKKYVDELEKVREKAVELSLKEERNKRKSRAEERKETEAKKKLLDALKERNLNLSPRVPFNHPELMDMARLTVSLPLMQSHECVKFDDDSNLVWPVLLQYSEAGQTDVLTETSELTAVGTLLQEVLREPAEWDPEHKFKFENVRFFVSDQYDEYLMEVYEWNDFKTVFSMPGYQIKQGLPVIMILTKEKASKSLEAIAENENRYVAK
ncbi:unnamed protein product [Caenorhabditis sp. 36 PRJEB53466]|nr:unnamed protein product [Caenorhabditis sp. 36 PRJEB53466]